MVSNKNVERKQIMRVNLRTAEDVKQGRMKTSCSSTTDKRRKSLSLKIEERTPKKERDNTRSEEGGKDEEEEEEEEGEKKTEDRRMNMLVGLPKPPLAPVSLRVDFGFEFKRREQEDGFSSVW